jgi:hypothetical protein
MLSPFRFAEQQLTHLGIQNFERWHGSFNPRAGYENLK